MLDISLDAPDEDTYKDVHQSNSHDLIINT